MAKYLVALQCGGIMEQPYFTYQNKEVIEAKMKVILQGFWPTKS